MRECPICPNHPWILRCAHYDGKSLLLHLNTEFVPGRANLLVCYETETPEFDEVDGELNHYSIHTYLYRQRLSRPDNIEDLDLSEALEIFRDREEIILGRTELSVP